jgi:pyruvate kinase
VGLHVYTYVRDYATLLNLGWPRRIRAETGDLARIVAKWCPNVPIVVFTSSKKVARQLILHRAVHTAVIPNGHLWNINKDRVVEQARQLGYCQSGDTVVVLTGEVQSKDASSSTGIVLMVVQ